jgi:hypothetical protein
MKFDNTNALQRSPGPIESPRCVRCDTAMRHSCTEDIMTPAGTHRVYQCVKCRSTQSVVTADA